MSRPLRELSFPIQYLETFESLIRSAGGDLAELYRLCRVSQQQALDMSGTLDGEQFKAAIAVSRACCRPGRSEAAQFLDHLPLTAHGPLGLLAMASQTLGDALHAAVEFMPLVLPAFALHCDLIRDQVHLVFERQADFGEHNDLLTEVVMGAFNKITPFMAEPFHEFSIHLRHLQSGRQPLNLTGSSAEQPIHYGAAQNKIVFPRRVLSIALVTQSRTLRAAFESSLSQQARAEQHFKPTSQRVKRLIKMLMDDNKVADGDAIAQAMHWSRRTLSRRLQEEGTTLPQLHAQVRMEFAQTLLLNSDRPIAEIARRAGFTELSNFTRAFKRLSGQTPSELRGSQAKRAQAH